MEGGPVYVVQLDLAEEAAAVVRATWQRLAAAGMGEVLALGWVPHVTLAAFGQMDVALAVETLSSFFGERVVPPLRFETLGSFPGDGVLQMGPVVTAELLALHAHLHEVLGPATSKGDYYYRPGNWNPHCTLAVRLSRAELAEAYRLVVETWEPLTAQVAQVRLAVPAPTMQTLYTIRSETMSEEQREGQSGGLPDWLRKEAERLQGRSVEHVENIGKGEGEQMAILSFDNDTAALAKWNTDAPSGLFEDEAEGMRTLRQATGSNLYIPDVLGYGDQWLMMENVKEGKKEDAAASFGRGLAEMHKKPQERYGYGEDNYLGPLLQPNHWTDDWVDFFREQRLRRAMTWLDDSDPKGGERRRKLEAIAERLEEWLDGEGITPSLLHGHLTTHSWMGRETGQAVLVDPAPYHGHREVDLAALRLQGELPQTFWQAYEEVWPLEEGFEARMPVYQLYYVLAQMAMGEDVGGQLDQILEQLAD